MTTQENHKPVIVIDVGKVLVDINLNVVLEELSKRYNLEEITSPTLAYVRSNSLNSAPLSA